ncbi:MAG: ATP-binding protein [Pseudobdellovibrionaceae bacterium]
MFNIYNMFYRSISKNIKESLVKFKAIALIGPRQSGKTTIARSELKPDSYFNLELPDVREFALRDPKSFLMNCQGITVLDEIQRAPTLVSYLQVFIDEPTDQRKWILTGSNSFSLSDQISQSLAGRIRIFKVLPLAYNELPNQLAKNDLDEQLWTGLYPRIYNENLEPHDWLGSYLETYVEKDVRSVLQVENAALFDRFLRLSAGRTGQLLSASSLATEVGVTQPTITRWLSVLESSFIIYRLQPHFRNFNKRIIKSPKIYFYDTGLLCYLLRIQTPTQLRTHPLRGFIFENWIITELMKTYLNTGKEAPFYFWRDQHGHEVDLVIDHGEQLELYEIKSGLTPDVNWVNGINWLADLQGSTGGTVIYGGSEQLAIKNVQFKGWQFVLGYSS